MILYYLLMISSIVFKLNSEVGGIPQVSYLNEASKKNSLLIK